MLEDKSDKVLSYRAIDTNIKTIDFFGIQMTNASLEQIVALILSQIENNNGVKQFSFLDPLRIMQIHFSKKKLQYLDLKNQIFLPNGKGLCWASRLLKQTKKPATPIVIENHIKYRDLFMALMEIAYLKGHSVYFISNLSKRTTTSMQRKLLKVFSKLRIIGNHPIKQSTVREDMVKQSLLKTAPDIVILGYDFWKQEQWISENWKYFKREVVFGMDNHLGKIYGFRSHLPFAHSVSNNGWSWIFRMLLQPWRLDYWFYAVSFYILVICKYLSNRYQQQMN